MTVSEALRAAHLGHVIAFGYHERMNPAEQWNVSIVPALSLSPEMIEAAQAVAVAVGRRLAFIGGHFEFVSGPK